MTAQHVLEILALGIPSAMQIELTASVGTLTFDVQNDLASLACGRSAAALAIRLRWQSVAIATLGAVASTAAVIIVHWANGGVGQFAFAYSWPLWVEVWNGVGFWVSMLPVLLWYSSMQRQLVWMALKQPSTLWIIAITVVWVAAWASLYSDGVHQSTWVTVPICIDLLLFFPLIAMADALPPKLRLCVLRYLGPAVCGCTAIIALTLRLPAAENTPGLVVWSVMGTDTVTNLQALTYSSTVMTLLLTKGVLRAWILPDQLAFITTTLRLATMTGASASDGPQESGARIAVGPMARSSIAPHPLVPSELA